MAERITQESWEQIATKIIDIVEDNLECYGSDNFAIYELGTYLEDEGIIEVIKD